jgi:hypothetical protein
MTGGYGNSYAATVGNQAYQASLQNLNDIIPELYAMAYDKYNQEGQDLLNQYNLLMSDYEKAYGEYNDEYNRLVADRGYWGTEADNAFNRDWGMYSDNRDFEQTEHHNAEAMDYETWRDAIEDEQWQKNYELSERELQMREEAWELEKSAYNSTVGSSGSSGSSSSGNNKTSDNCNKTKTVTPKETKAANNFIAVHYTKDEYMRRGHSYNEFKTYIDAEISKVQDSFSDEELAYLARYYGLS